MFRQFLLGEKLNLYLLILFLIVGKVSNQRNVGTVQVISPDGSVSSQDHSSSFYIAGSGQSSTGPRDVRNI